MVLLYTIPIHASSMACSAWVLLAILGGTWIYPLFANMHLAEYVVGPLYNVYMYLDESKPFDD
jgi:hypothetical protein